MKGPFSAKLLANGGAIPIARNCEAVKVTEREKNYAYRN
jgi:hypothetical protein